MFKSGLSNVECQKNLSAPGTAVLFLVWQQPTDRALAGWAPYPGLHPEGMSAESLTHWLRDQVLRTSGEEYDVTSLNRVLN
jgi:hypothetical protein